MIYDKPTSHTFIGYHSNILIDHLNSLILARLSINDGDIIDYNSNSKYYFKVDNINGDSISKFYFESCAAEKPYLNNLRLNLKMTYYYE